IAKIQLDDELEQFAIPTPAPKAEVKPAPSIAKIQLDDDLEQFAIPTPTTKAEVKPTPSIAKIQLDDELEQFVIPTPKAEPTISQIMLDDELEELVTSTKDTEGRILNIDDIDDMMIKPVKAKVDIDKMVNEIKETNKIKERSEVATKLENASMSAMEEISSVKVNPVQEVEPITTETVQKVAEIPTPKTEVQFQPSARGNQQPLQEAVEQPDMQEINTNNSKNEQQIIYNELGQPLYPVYNDKGQLFYTAVAPAKKQQKPEPEVEVAVEDITVKQKASPTVAALIAANAKKKAVIEDSGVHKVTEPIVDSVEAALSQLGANNVNEKKSKEVVPVFTEYKAPPKKTNNNQMNNRREEQNVPLTRAEIKRQKKLEKINNEFEKKLKERGFDLDESKRKKRAAR
ncbi:MAG TPA: hypothetical protein GX710_05950, partial [Clostridiales bacterium]|nr:hypothetical protein [Clostridiales bacterium]